MAVTKSDVEYVADLARLEPGEEEKEQLVNDMNEILEYMELLGEVDTSKVEPLKHVTELHAPLRADKAEKPLDHSEALKNAPSADSDYFRVPKVIE